MNGLHILVVEDNVLNQKVVARALTKHDAEVATADNGQEAIEKLTTQNFDAILMDIQMPVMDGIAALHHIRNVIKSDIPVVAMTASTSTDEASKCIAAGANEYLPKPIDTATLHLLMLDVIRKAKGINAPEASTSQLLDLSYIYELAGEKEDYVQQVLTIFMENTPRNITELGQFVQQKNWAQTSSQAHLLKSSIGIVRIAGLAERLQTMEHNAAKTPDENLLQQLYNEVVEIFSRAEIEIVAKMTT